MQTQQLCAAVSISGKQVSGGHIPRVLQPRRQAFPMKTAWWPCCNSICGHLVLCAQSSCQRQELLRLQQELLLLVLLLVLLVVAVLLAAAGP